MSPQRGDTVYLPYVGNIPTWSRDVFTALVSGVSDRYVTVAIRGEAVRFERASLRHDNRGRNPAYQLFPTREAYELAVEAAELRSLMSRTDFGSLPVETQRAIKAILAA